MSLFINYYITCGLVLVILLLFLKYCRNTWKVYQGYPVFFLIPYLLYWHIFRKIPKDVPLNSFVFHILCEKCLQHMKEGICMVYISRPVLVFIGEEPVKIFLNEKKVANKPDVFYDVVKDNLGLGLITSNGERWKNHRKMLNPAFCLGILKDKVSIFNEHALAFVKDLESVVDKPSVDVLDFIKYHCFNSLSESVFGFKQTEENRAENQKFSLNVDFLSTSMIYKTAYPWLQWKFLLPTFSYGRQILRANVELFCFSKNTILKMKQKMISNETSDAESLSQSQLKSLTYILLKQHLNDPSFTFEDLHDHVITFLSAGYDTVSYALLWCLFMLGMYPEVQEKAYNEVQFSSADNYISYDDCSNFTYLEAVILETLRLYPTVPIFGRQLSQDIQCGERNIPKDTIIGFFPYVTHRNPDIYPDPEDFDPERFLGRTQNKAWTYIAFSEGYRSCIGKKYALIEMKIFLAYFLRNFKITSLDRREDIRLCWGIVLSPAKPLRMHIERR